MPKLTVLMTVYDGIPYLKEAIDSILNQTFRDFEFLVIDDASKDRSCELIESYSDDRIRLLRNRHNIGQTRSLNYGIKVAKGKYIARIDQDDIALPERLEKQFAFFKENPDVVLLGTWWEEISQEGLHIRFVKRPAEYEEIIEIIGFNNPFGHSSVMFKLNAVQSIGGYPENYSFAQDRLLWVKLSSKYKVANLPQVLVKVRTHPLQATSKGLRSLRMKETFQILCLTLLEIDLPKKSKKLCHSKLSKLAFLYSQALIEEGQNDRAVLVLLNYARSYPTIWIKNLNRWSRQFYRATIHRSTSPGF
jgi:glycosyltransferase involved in cell wall biosynthesis